MSVFLSVGIVGLPNVGKSTLFNALLKRRIAKVGKYPFTTVGKNTGVVMVPDERLKRLAEVVKGKEAKNVEVRPAAIKFVDIAGLVKGAHKGEGLGNEFLGHIREVDVICHVVRVFEDPNVPRVIDGVDPKRDIEVVNTELILKDLEGLEARSKKLEARKDIIEKLVAGLNQGKMVKDLGLSEKEKEIIKDLFLLTEKPTICVLNVSEEQVSQFPISPNISLCAKLEEELFDFEPKEQKEYLQAIGLKELGVDQLIKKCFNLLGLLTFYTIAGGKIVQAWPLRRGKTALEASEKVHTDMAKGFIKAEVAGFKDLVEAGSWPEAEKLGKVRIEGRDYVMRDGEVVEFRFA